MHSGRWCRLPIPTTSAASRRRLRLTAQTEQAILGGGDGCFDCFPVIGLVNLAAGTFSEFGGIGFGFINGIAVDSADGIFCTTTEDDANVEFYDLATQTGFQVVLPGSEGQQYYSGAMWSLIPSTSSS